MEPIDHIRVFVLSFEELTVLKLLHIKAILISSLITSLSVLQYRDVRCSSITELVAIKWSTYSVSPPQVAGCTPMLWGTWAGCRGPCLWPGPASFTPTQLPPPLFSSSSLSFRDGICT